MYPESPRTSLLFPFVALLCLWGVANAQTSSLRVAPFDVDATPPVGSALPYSSTTAIVQPLRCRGLVLLSDEAPVVLCAVDWLGIGNDGNRIFRERLAAAAKTTPDRVAVHTLHQHDAPWCDFSADTLAKSHGATGIIFDSSVANQVIARAADAIEAALKRPYAISQIGLGQAKVEQVGSNRRVLGADGKVAAVRWTATKDPAVRAAPEGVIDPWLRSIRFYEGDTPIAVLTYYATHPQSYYGKGEVNPDFPGIARDTRQSETGNLHVHFNGAAGNIGAGKYNDGSPENRTILAQRMADAMKRSIVEEKRFKVSGSELHWKTQELRLPPTQRMDREQLMSIISDPNKTAKERIYAATQWVWLTRCAEGDPIVASCLKLGPARILHLPGELFIEYQLAAAEMLPGEFVATAAYGDYAPCYIGTAIAYEQGGYETEARSSLVSPECEAVLIETIQKLLGVEAKSIAPLGAVAAKREVEYARSQQAQPEAMPK